jgi:hypothetical protein
MKHILYKFGSCQTLVWQLPNSGLVAATLGFGSYQTGAWQLGSRQNRGLAAAKLWFGSCQTRAWQLPNSGLAWQLFGMAAGQPPKSGSAAATVWFGSCQTLAARKNYDNSHPSPRVIRLMHCGY